MEPLGAEDWSAVALSLRAALASTAIILPPGVALAWLLARRRWPGKILVETLVALPLVMPPVATGLVLLELFSPRGAFGAALARAGLRVVFTPLGVVVAMMVMSLPLLVRGARAAIEEVDPRLEQMARTLGAGEARVLATVTLPLARRGIAAAALLAFARALGEFGATILVAGNVPGRTTTLAVAIYSSVQLGRSERAATLALVAAAICFAALLATEMLVRRRPA